MECSDDRQSTSDDHKAKKPPCKAPVEITESTSDKKAKKLPCKTPVEITESTSDKKPKKPLCKTLVEIAESTSDEKAKKPPCKTPMEIQQPSPAPVTPLPPVVRSPESKVLDGVGKEEKENLDGVGKEDKEKVEFRATLTREEWEEDCITMTGEPPPASRPSKRSKTEQFKHDLLYPGTSLPRTITPSLYRKDSH